MGELSIRPSSGLPEASFALLHTIGECLRRHTELSMSANSLTSAEWELHL